MTSLIEPIKIKKRTKNHSINITYPEIIKDLVKWI